MIKLQNIIAHLDQNLYNTIEETLKKNKAENFLYLFQSYRSGQLRDAEICESLGITSNSLYVLKSRLNDKIQENLSGDIFANKESVIQRLHEIPEMCYHTSIEIADAFLLKLERDLLMYDMHNELLVVYSALKKIHLHSEKYFYYSQLFNRHTAFHLSLEKCEEILGNFNRVLAQYNFARTAKLMETLLFLKKDIHDHFVLNPSRQIEIIKNLVSLQLVILTTSQPEPDFNTEQILSQTEKLINNLPESAFHKHWITAHNYLAFEFYRKQGQLNLASTYYEKLDASFTHLLLFTSVTLTSKFLLSKINFEQQINKFDAQKTLPQLLYNAEDEHTVVLLSLHKAMLAYHAGNLKEATSLVNQTLNEHSFKDFFHINLEIRLTLSFFYMRMNEFDLADNILKNIARKIKSEEMDNYSHVLSLIKVFNADIKQNISKVSAKQKDDFLLFTARNVKDHEVLSHLVFDLQKIYS